MILMEHPETPYDLKFRIGSIPVRVHPFFWLMSIVLGWDFTHEDFPRNLGYLAMWVGGSFFSVLLHELGHVWMGMAFGTHGYIVLWGFGGLAIGSSDIRERWKRIAVSLAGPGIQLILFVILWFSREAILRPIPADWREHATTFLFMMIIINFFWPLLNLLPIWPLDGGKVTRELCQAVSYLKGLETSLLISILVAGILALNAFLSKPGHPLIPYLSWFGGSFLAIFFAISCVQSVQLYQQERSRGRWDDDLPWER